MASWYAARAICGQYGHVGVTKTRTLMSSTSFVSAVLRFF